MLSDSGGPARRWFAPSRLTGFARRFAWLAVVPALMMGDVAQSASLMNSVCPRLPTNIGPRGPVVDSVGPRFDPTFRSSPGGASQYGTAGGGSTGGASGNGNASNGGGSTSTKPQVASRRTRSGVPPANELHYIRDEVVFEAAGNPSDQALIGLLNRFHLARIETRRIALLNTTFYRARILDGTTVPVKLRAMEAAGAVRAQPNYLFTMVQSATQSADAPQGAQQGADSAQYALAKLRLDEAHTLARGDNVLVAVIDSGIDVNHPALTGVVEKSFDALNSSEGPHSHGTAIAGIIAGHNRLIGAAPAVHILAARAFSTTQGSTVSIIASLDWAAQQGARVVNMSFAGPSDPALGRSLAAAHQKGVVLVAASGNAGPKSPPLWPAADPNVIAVTATDFDDHLFAMANRGAYVALAAPGVDILVANPGDTYKMESGTSFSAAFVSGVAALVIERQPKLTPDGVKKVLLATAHDLGPKGRDDQFGAGLMDAFQAVSAVDKSTDAALQVPAH
ncbi:MAG TPA: S8 family serine peptidase [Xanthobacteraceae bacterium]